MISSTRRSNEKGGGPENLRMRREFFTSHWSDDEKSETDGGQSMSDAVIADIARALAGALKKRAHDRQPEDLKLVLEWQARLVQACEQELTDPAA
jgi:hypothetical protein